jgi:hypothetical protein
MVCGVLQKVKVTQLLKKFAAFYGNKVHCHVHNSQRLDLS